MLSVLWTAATKDDSSQVTGSSVFDFDGDGRNEVVYNDEAYIRIYPGIEPDCALKPPGPGCDKNMTDAEVLFRDRNSSRTRTEFPVIADVNGDFKADIVFSTNNDSNASLVTDAGIEVFKDSLDNWVSTRPVWNQHTYHITNVGLVGEIPVMEDNNWSAGTNLQQLPQQRAGRLGLLRARPRALRPRLRRGRVRRQARPLGLRRQPGLPRRRPGRQRLVLRGADGPARHGPDQGRAGGRRRREGLAVVPGKFESVTVWAVADDDGMGNGVLNECDEINNSLPKSQVCVPPG